MLIAIRSTPDNGSRWDCLEDSSSALSGIFALTLARGSRLGCTRARPTSSSPSPRRLCPSAPFCARLNAITQYPPSAQWRLGSIAYCLVNRVSAHARQGRIEMAVDQTTGRPARGGIQATTFVGLVLQTAIPQLNRAQPALLRAAFDHACIAARMHSSISRN